MTASIKQDVLYEYMQQESKYISQIDDLERVIEALTIDYNNPDGPIKVNITNGFVIGYIRNELARREFLIIHN